MDNKKILVINAGSSSIKLQLLDKKTFNVIASGLAERITLNGGIITLKFNGQKFEDQKEMPDHEVAVQIILELMKKYKIIENIDEIELIGFRVVHGGVHFNSSTKLDDRAIKLIDESKIYAPLHNPGALQAIRAFKHVMPNAKLSADFDTAFHTTIPDVNAIYPIPMKLTKQFNIRRYGAHGISHQYISLKAAEILGKKHANIINLHIGNGASICAIKEGKSIDTSMGLTPLAGIMMGTRSGDIDPSIHEFITAQLNIDIKEFTRILNKESGLLGVSGVSSDMRDIDSAIKNGNEQAKFAFELYVQRIVDTAAMYANKIGKVDAIVFTAGVGENSPLLRQKVIEKINFANVSIDKDKNIQKYDDYLEISTPESEIKVFVIRTNEELMIAKHAVELYEE